MFYDKVIFLIPGYRQHPTQKAYRQLASMLRSEGYHPVFSSVRWKDMTVSENAEVFLKEFSSIKAKKKYVLGFSWGAMIALVSATKVQVQGLMLCSLSPYFREDLKPQSKRWMSPLKSKRFHDFSSLDGKILAKNIQASQVSILFGTREDQSLKKRSKTTFLQIPTHQKILVPIKKTEHTLSDNRYLSAIHHVAKIMD